VAKPMGEGTQTKAGGPAPADGPQRATPAPAKRRHKLSPLKRREALSAYIFLSAPLLLFVVFLGGPLIAVFGISVLEWNLLTQPQFSGLENYKQLLSDPTARAAIQNTFVFAFWSVVLHLGFGLLLALAVNRAMPAALTYFLRTAYFFPLIISWAAVALMWRYILDPNFGFLPYYLSEIGLSIPNVLVSPGWAMPALIFVDFWRTIGLTFIILLAGLQGIPSQLYEAAKVDGAGSLQRFWYVTIPMLSPTLFFALVITFIGAFQIFEPMYIITQGGPGDATRSIVMNIFETGFRSFEMGYASAQAVVVFLVIMVVTLVQIGLSRYWVHYE
jgi:multiple sugar transport system permease protein